MGAVNEALDDQEAEDSGATIEPSEKGRHHTRVSSQPVTSSLDDPQFGVAFGRLNQCSRLGSRDHCIVRAVDDHQMPGWNPRDRTEWIERNHLRDELLRRDGCGIRDDPGSFAGSGELIDWSAPCAEVSRGCEGHDAADPLVVGSEVQTQGSTKSESSKRGARRDLCEVIDHRS